MNKKQLEKIKLSEVKAFKFSDAAIDKKPVLDYKNVYDFFIEKYIHSPCIFGQNNLKNSGYYKIYGWAFDFKPYLKQYFYTQYDMNYKAYAPNKTLLKNTCFGRIYDITEIINK